MKKVLAIFLSFLLLLQIVPFYEPIHVSAGSTTYDGNQTSVGAMGS